MVLEFQIYDWMETHETKKETSDDESTEDSVSPKNKGISKYIMYVFGRTQDGKSVFSKIINYTPYFYIKLPSKWKKRECKANVKELKKWLLSDKNRKVWDRFKSGFQSIKVVERKTAESFTNNKTFYYARLIFNNSYSMRKFRLLFEENYLYIPQIDNKKKFRFKKFDEFIERNIVYCINFYLKEI